MIKEIIQNIKDGAVNSGNNLLMDKNAYKEYLFTQTQKQLQKHDKILLISKFDVLSANIILENLEPVSIDFKNDMPVKEFINCFKYSLLTGYIVSEILKTTYTESPHYNIN